ncbi:hypothetical protein PR202_gb11213 [Eleusine coracana subsp. coracana]|uniref:1-phosphatidylinositol 4-kinase n=1 Tax=Eleusine coracana subsp. coracana TaxID=191504 RepID=A0AAV5ELE5_ELECO|nr:hypothetical protein PR202_gb11213 [Eleusine coracana subsp. coracana]
MYPHLIYDRDAATFRGKISSDKWIDHARTAFAVDPRIALSMTLRFPTNAALQSEITQLVQTRLLELRTIPEALPFFITPKAVNENSALLQQLPHWAPCSVTQALEFLTPPYKGHPRVMAYVLRVLETYPPETVTFFMPQLVQSLRYDEGGECVPEESGKDSAAPVATAFHSLLPAVRQKIVDSFTPDARDMFEREFDFFDKVTSISGVLFPLPKEERRAGIRRELEKITVPGDDLYLPTATNKLVRGIQLDSGIPLQSAAKVPIMITFNVVDRDGNPNDIKPQACIFKVGDDCRQDVLALQVIALLRDIFQAVGLNLYLFPYGVLPTGPERGIIEVNILCVKGYLAARRHMNGILTTVNLMVDSGLPCFSRGDPIGNLRKRFHPEMNEREAANFMVKTCVDAYNKWTTAGYDLIQYLQQGIEK